MTTDVALNDSKGYFDFDWAEDGDISTASNLDTSILMSLFCEARAAASEIPNPALRRGWIGNETTPNFEQGSKAWEFEQERVTGSVLAELGVIIRKSLQWLIDDGIAVNVTVEQPTIKNGRVCVFINLFRDGSPVDRRFYDLWDATFNGR